MTKIIIASSPLKLNFIQMKNLHTLLLFILSGTSFISCKKDWLDVKPDSNLIVPAIVADYQALLDNSGQMNLNATGVYGEISAGDSQLSYASYLKAVIQQRNAYIWSSTDDFYGGQVDYEWRSTYQRILNANVAIEGLGKVAVNASNQLSWNNAMGSALFYRAYDFYNLAQEYCKPYTSAASSDLGIPLRLTSDINMVSTRASVKQTYDQVIADLKVALTMLPVSPLFKTRPSQPAVYAMLARVYLSMGDYQNALINANACLNLSNTLIDFSNLSTTSTTPIARFNSEVIYHCVMSQEVPFLSANMDVTRELLSLFDTNDLRSKIFFRVSGANTVFKGSYNGSSSFFSGLAVDEILLIRSECNARSGHVQDALTDLNNLLKNRYVKTPAYVDFTTLDKDIALSKILIERRKELCFRGLRWTDLRRLNQDPNYQVTLTRSLNGQTYQLPPNDPRYVFPIDPNEIRISGIQQNPRH